MPPDPSPQPHSEPRPKSDRDLIEAAMGQAAQALDLEGSALPPADSFPGYEVVREVHRGGQGVVYQAIQKATKRRVAIKVLHEGPFAGSAGKARFEREVQILGQLSHPNIVKVIDSGATSSGSCYYVMEYISGRALDEHLKASKDRPSIEDALRLFLKVCDAVHAAHLRGVIHRDLKPSNIRVTPEGEPVVVDFGLAKVAVPDVTEESHPQLMTVTGQFIGSLPWASPEQAEGSPGNIDLRTDVYSLGVILYQMLTSRFPYEVVGNMRDVLDNILKATPARPSTVRKQINDEVETIVLKCLSKERDRRYQSAGELARDIRHYLDGEPIEAKRDSGWYVLSKTLKRHRAAVMAAIAFVLLILVSVVVLAAMYQHQRVLTMAARRSEQKASDKEREAVAAQGTAERERIRAEENYRQLRQVASEFLFGVDDKLETVIGSGSAREDITRKAHDLHTFLKDQASEDPAFLADFAESAESLGDLYGGFLRQSIGEYDKARECYEQAETIRSNLLAANPSSWRAHHDIGRSCVRRGWLARHGVGSMAERLPLATAAFLSAIPHFDRALELLAATDADATFRVERDRVSAVQYVGQVTFIMAQVEAEGERWGEAADLLEEASRLLDRVDGYWSARYANGPDDPSIARELGVVLSERTKTESLRVRVLAKTDLDAALAHFDRYRPTAERAAQIFESLRDKNWEDRRFTRDLGIGFHNLGLLWMERADARDDAADGDQVAAPEDHIEAMRWYEAATDVARTMLERERRASPDTPNVTTSVDLANYLHKAGRERFRLRMWDEAAAAFDESLRIRRGLPANPRHREMVAIELLWCANLDRARGEAADDPVAAKRLIERAIENATEAVAHFDAVKPGGQGWREATETREACVAWLESQSR